MINSKLVKFKISRPRSKVLNAKVRVYEDDVAIVRFHGKPNIKRWAIKVKQILDDLEAGRYEDEEIKNNSKRDCSSDVRRDK